MLTGHQISIFLENECLPLMLRDSLSNGVHSCPHRLGQSSLPFTCTWHFFCNLVFMAPAPAGALSKCKPWPELPCFRNSRMWGSSWSMQPALLPEVYPFFSLLPQEQHPGPQPTAWGWETCFKIWACRTCQHPGSGKRTALGQDSSVNQSCFGEVGGLYVGPTLPWPNPYENVWVWMRKRKQSTFHACCRRAKTRFYFKITPLSWRLKANIWA